MPPNKGTKLTKPEHKGACSLSPVLSGLCAATKEARET